MRKTVRILIIASLCFTSASALGAVGASKSTAVAPRELKSSMSKKDVIERLKNLKEKQITEVTSLESAIRKRLQESLTMGLNAESLPVADRRANQMAEQIEDLSKKKEEANARREILDRLIFLVDTKYSSQPLKTFFEQQFIEMAANDLADGRDGRLWKALTYLSICIREVPEPREDVIDVLEGYFNFSSVLNPKTPADFQASRNYTNGSQSEIANTTSREELSNDIEATLSATTQSARDLNPPVNAQPLDSVKEAKKNPDQKTE